MKDVVKYYSTDKVKVKWQPKLCIHSGICAAGLPGVFKPKEKPWINVEGAEAPAVIDQVSQCPSGALSIAE